MTVKNKLSKLRVLNEKGEPLKDLRPGHGRIAAKLLTQLSAPTSEISELSFEYIPTIKPDVYHLAAFATFVDGEIETLVVVIPKDLTKDEKGKTKPPSNRR